MPDLYIIAGPNGSGKSLFSKALVTTEYAVFDGDYHITLLKAKFPETGSDLLEKYVNDNQFMMAKEKAIAENKSFAFETNFSADDPLISQWRFKDAGFKTHLYYIGLDTLEESSQRVERRVAEGGHKVSEQAIAYNFHHGYQNLVKFYNKFNSVSLFSNPVNEKQGVQLPLEIMRWENNVLAAKTNDLPAWMERFVNESQPIIFVQSEEQDTAT